MAITRIALRIDELDCAEEVVQLQDHLLGKQGIEELAFDIVNGRMVVSFDRQKSSIDEIVGLVSEIGMHARRDNETGEARTAQGVDRVRMGLTLCAGIATAGGFVTHVISAGELLAPLDIELISDERTAPITAQLLYLLSIGLGFWYVVPKAWLAARKLRADMNLLMCIAVVGAICLGQWLEAAIVTFLFQVSLLLEHQSMARARRAVHSLLNLTPPTARVIESVGEAPHERPVAEVEAGARILVHPAEHIPLDGRVIQGESSVNQAPITGESLPVGKTSGDSVFAGTINGEGTLEIEVTRQARDSTLARIIHLVQEAHAGRAPSEQWVEKFARYYTPVMMGLALIIAVGPPLLTSASWSIWIYNALVLLVIACPCALVISTPVSIVSALTRAANHGVLIKGGQYLEAVAGLRAIAIDKTGTLTRGEPVVKEVVPLNGHSRAELLERAVALESQSTHPIAKAILECGQREGVQVAAAEAYQTLSGRGAEGKIDGKPYWIGSHRLMLERMPTAESAHNSSVDLKAAGSSVIAIGSEAHVCGLISVADSVREGVDEVVRELRLLGVRHIRMLTGDNQETGQAIAEAVGVDGFLGEALPEDKLREVQRLRQQYGSVAMIGDGVNDSPALATATVGIVMGAIGTDAAIEAADIALMSDDLSKVPWLIRLSRRTLRVIKQNIAFALGLKFLFVALAAFGLASLWMAIAADTGASLLVVFNGMRLLRK